MRPNKLRELLKAGKPTISTHIHTTWPSIVEAIGHTGRYDYVEFVGEYGPFDLHDLDNLCRAADLHNMSMMIKVDQEPQFSGAARHWLRVPQCAACRLPFRRRRAGVCPHCAPGYTRG